MFTLSSLSLRLSLFTVKRVFHLFFCFLRIGFVDDIFINISAYIVMGQCSVILDIYLFIFLVIISGGNFSFARSSVY